MQLNLNNALVRLVFFGNYFYGICAVALAIEASFQQEHPLNSLLYYIATFAATVLYYTKAYITDGKSVPDPTNRRSVWYAHHPKLVWWGQVIFTMVVLAFALYTVLNYWPHIMALSVIQWGLIFVFPVVAALYYGLENGLFFKFNLRNIGWLKPFVIGFTWAGMINVYPLLYLQLQRGINYDFTWVGFFLFIKNMMYVSVLCIMFDIKDYAQDYNHRLKTFVVKVGLRKTIFSIIIPLTLIGFGSFLVVAFVRDFSIWRILINTIPFLSLIAVAYSLSQRKNIFYYLVIIDGLMLLKAVCGSVAMLF
jgi:hypothetical protein